MVAVVDEAPDLRVTHATATRNRGTDVVISAEITNIGGDAAAPSHTEFRLDDGTVLGTADTPALQPGQSAVVSVTWEVRGDNRGGRTVAISADAAGVVREANETNNTGTLRLVFVGNRLEGSSFDG